MTAAAIGERNASSSRHAIPRAASIAVIGVGLVSALTNAIITLLSDRVSASDTGWPWQTIGVVGLAVGAVIAFQRPTHPVGWILLGLALGPLSGALLAARLVVADPTPSWWITTSEALATVGFAAPIPLILLVFPTGRLLSRRWRAAVGLTLLSAAIGTAASLITGGWAGLPEDAVAPSPLSPGLDRVGNALSSMFFPLYLASLICALASVLLRYRRSRGDERLQLRWLAAAATTVVPMMALSVLGWPVQSSDLLMENLLVGALCLVPIGVGVAVLKYRLYEIDVVISRALVYGALAAFITATYALVVVGIGALVGRGDEPNLLLSIVATALVAVVFEPLRSRLQRFANRVVYGARATPYEVLTALTAGFAVTEVGAEGPQRLARLLAAGTGAADATVWLRVGNELRPIAQAPTPRHPGREGVRVTDDALPQLDVRLAVPVHDGQQLIGALGINKSRGDAATSSDQRLLDDVAGSAGLLLRNLRLQAELRGHAEQLQESRARLVATQDAARRQLERDLHDGAQQHLVALRLKLGLAGGLARKEGVPGVDEELKLLSDSTQRTVDAVRSVARGIYPPLLEAEGLAAAVSGAARLGAVPVAVHVEGLARYPRAVESTVYFCIVEAINNAATHGRPANIEVTIDATDAELTFAVRDDGSGFDPAASTSGTGLANLADRLDVLGGTLVIDSRPGSGARVTGRLPLPAHAEPTSRPEAALVHSGQQ